MIYSTGGEVGIAMFDWSGDPDTSFSDDGRWQADFRLERVARRDDPFSPFLRDQVIIAGTEKVNANRRRAIVRVLDATGNSATSFGDEGTVDLGVASHVTDLALFADDFVLGADNITVVVNRAPDGTSAEDQQRIAQLSYVGRFD